MNQRNQENETCGREICVSPLRTAAVTLALAATAVVTAAAAALALAAAL